MPRLIVEELHHRFGRQAILRGISFHGDAGEAVVLFGVNGAGKSTLLSLLATRLRVQKGRYLLNDLDTSQNSEATRAALLFIGHHTHLYGHLSALENLEFFMDLRGMARSRGQLLAAIETVGLSRFAERPVIHFSAGMRKRLALARMVLAPPSLLLLDEPYSALDAQGVQWLNQVLRQFLDQGGLLMMATHDPERVAPLSPRSLHLDQGVLVDSSFSSLRGGVLLGGGPVGAYKTTLASCHGLQPC